MYLLDLTAAFLAGYGVCNVVTMVMDQLDSRREAEKVQRDMLTHKTQQTIWREAVRENQDIRADEEKRKGVRF